MTYYIYTDGSTKGNGTSHSAGGWAYVILDEQNVQLASDSGAQADTTNQQMELTAAIRGLTDVALRLLEQDTVVLYSDSAYLINCRNEHWYKRWVSNGWQNSKKETVANKELWKLLIPYFNDSRFTFLKVKGHATNQFNNYVDSLAQNAAANYQKTGV